MAELKGIVNGSYVKKEPKQSEDKTDALYTLRQARDEAEQALIMGGASLETSGVPNAINKLKNYLHQSRQGKPLPEDYLDGFEYEIDDGTGNKTKQNLKEMADKIRNVDGQIDAVKKSRGDTSFQPSPLAKEWNTWGQSTPTQPQKAQMQTQQAVQSQPVQKQVQGQQQSNSKSDDEELKKLETAMNTLGQPYRQMKDDYYKQPADKRDKYLQEQAVARGLDPEYAGKYIKAAVKAYNIRLKKGIIDANGNPIKQPTSSPKPQGKAKGTKGNKDTASNRKQFINEFLG